ncbi:hypothetical protein PKOR_20005 [Pontibacter korlensis]|uniref:Uncharacterized protein n=2 Tax=Pontibacter korlensis TaxID=400092 RepID=A0A0E3UZ23_9BACT|nr:hypothetical protein PKOR_20005 [Pontibacter korlensis]
MTGHAFAQKNVFQNYNGTRTSESSHSGGQVLLSDKNKAASPALQNPIVGEASYSKSQRSFSFPDYWPDRLFIKLKEGQNGKLQTFETRGKDPKVKDGGKLSSMLLGHQATSVAELPRIQKGERDQKAYQVMLENSGNLQLLMQELEALPEVEYVERVPYYVALQSPNDPEYLTNKQYALHKTKAAEAFGIHTGSSKTLLAIVDDAVLISHPDLATNVNIAKSYDVADNDDDPRPPSSGANKAGVGNFSHGTHCAGIAGAVTNNGVGVAAISNNKVSIIGVKCTRDSAPTSRAIEYAAEGIIYAVNQGARVISMSFGGGGYSQTIQNIINEATANGVVFVAAAGNSNTEVKMYPAAYDNVIAVASTDANDLKSSFSNYGSWVDISAPGSGILSTVTAPDGISGAYTFYSGTSMACPMVASQIALMLSENPSLTPQAVTQLLKSTADPIDNIPNQSPLWAGKLGAGRINAFRAIQAIKGIANTVAPTAITNLQVVRAGQAELEVQWTAPGADGSAASLYDIRYSTEPITVANFEEATKLKNNIFPDQPGRIQKLVVQGLVPSTTYYFAIVSKSFYGNSSPISNVVSSSTLAAPFIHITPNFYNLGLDRTNSSTISRSFTLTNQGTARLNYNAALVPVAGNNVSAYDKQQPTADDAVGLGGSGFITAVKFTAGAKGFSLTHVQNFLNSSTTTASLPIGIRILKGGTNPANATLISSETFTRAVPAGGRLFNFQLQTPRQFAPGETFWVAFVLPNGLDYPQGFDVVDYMPNTFYVSTNNGSSYEDAQTLASFLAKSAFKVRVANANWISLEPVSGYLEPGQRADVHMAFDVTNVPDGVYHTNVSFASNDPFNPVMDRPVTLTVRGGQAKLAMEPKEISFGTLFVGASHTVSLVVANTGAATMTIKAETLNSEAFAATDFIVKLQSTISLAPGSRKEIPVTFTPSRKGVLNGSITLSTNGPAASTVTVPVVANVVSAPAAIVTPPFMYFELEPKGETTATEAVSIQNNGEAELSYALQALVDPLSTISYDANRNPDSYLGFGSQYPYIHTALRFDVKTATFNLTHLQNFIRTEVAGDKTMSLKVYKGGNSPTAGTLLLEQNFEAPASAVGGALVTLPLQHPKQFKQGDVIWVVFYYSGINQPQGYHTNTPNPGRNFYSPDGSSWSSLESAGGSFVSSTYLIRALEMPQWLNVSPGTGQVAGGESLQNEITVNAAGLKKGKYKGKIQVMTNDPNQPLTTVEVSLQVEDFPAADFSANITEVIPGETVTFLNLSKNADVFEWEFEGGEPASSTLKSPDVVYSTPGKYKVSLKAKSTQTERVSEALVKEDYIVVQNTLCHNLNYPFKGIESLTTTDDGYITGNNKQGDKAKANYFNFDRPDAYVTGVEVKFGFAAAVSPDATITVAVWDVDASSGEPRSILASKEVKLADVAADVATGHVTDVVFDTPVRLTGSFFAGVLLNTEGGNSVAIVHNDNSEPSPGTAWTQDSQNNWASFGTVRPGMANIALYIQPAVTQTLTPLAANFTISSESVCVGQQVQLDASSTVGAVRYEWLLEGAVTTTSTAVNPVAVYAAAGTYKVTLKAYDSCSGVIVTTKEINVQVLPDDAVTIAGSATLCEGEKVTLSAMAGDGLTYRWSNGATTRSIEVSTPGEYTVTVTNAANCTTTSKAVVIKVNPLPAARIAADGSTILCEGEKVGLSAPAGDGYTYLWSNGATTRTIETGTAGNYTVTVTNNNGCATASEAVVVSVNALPVAHITASGPVTFCQGNTVVLTASEGNSYLWSNGATTRAITVAESGSYTVSVTNSDGCAATSPEVRVTVNPLPDKPWVYRDDITLTSGAATGNQWFRNNIAIPGATGSVYEAVEPGVYQVLVTNASGCSSEMSEEIKVTEVELVTSLKVYPNPGNGLLHITFTGLKPDIVNVRILDMTGKVIYEGKKSMLDDRELQVDISTAAAGVYMLQVQCKTSNYSQRVIVQQ